MLIDHGVKTLLHQIISDEIAVFGIRQVVKSSNRQIVKSSNRQIVKSSNRQIVKSSNRQIVKSSNRQIVKSSNRQIVKSSSHEVKKSRTLFLNRNSRVSPSITKFPDNGYRSTESDHLPP